MEKREVTLYEFCELDKKVQEKLIKKEQEYLHETLDDEWLEESLIDRIQEAGYRENMEVFFSLSNCQGDGVSFTCSGIPSEIFTETIREHFPHMWELHCNTPEAFRIVREHSRYCHAYTCQLKIDVEDALENAGWEYADWEADNFCEWFHKTHYFPLCRSLEKFGYQYIEEQTSEERALENLTQSERLFYRDGRIFYD